VLLNCSVEQTSPMNLATLVDTLGQSQFYPHPTHDIKCIETHISMVFLTGEFAYKLKKPVNFGFLDFSTLANRKKFYFKELQLNRRTAPELYIDVLPVYLTTEQGQERYSLNTEDSASEPVEYLLKMRQFDPNKVLGNWLGQEAMSDDQVEALVEQIANLHLCAEQVEQSSEFGSTSVILKPMTDNFPSVRRFLDAQNASVQRQTLDEISQWTESVHHALIPVISRRKLDGWIRSCHGDLHLDNIALIHDKPLLFDAIEFNDYFSQIDVISDLAFLLTDLEYRNLYALGRKILSIYLHLTQDYQALKLLRFYKVYRSMVRAKISGLQAEQQPSDSVQFQSLKSKTYQYIELAKQQSHHQPKPRLILLQGVSGSGKSYFSALLQNHLDAIVISSDRTRKKLFGLKPLQRPKNSKTHQLYSKEMSAKTYATLLKNAEKVLQSEYDVIVDATFLRRDHRQAFYELAERLEVKSYLIYLQANSEQASEWITQRQSHEQNPSDADSQVMHNQIKVIEPPQADENSLLLEAQTLRNHWPKKKVLDFLELKVNSKET